MSVGECPELVGEAQVVADEQAAPDALDLDGDEVGAGSDVPVLVGVRERVDLPVAVDGPVGATSTNTFEGR